MPAWLRRQRWLAEQQAMELARALGGHGGTLLGRGLPAPAAARSSAAPAGAGPAHGHVEVSRSGKVFTRVAPGRMLDQIKSRTAL